MNHNKEPLLPERFFVLLEGGVSTRPFGVAGCPHPDTVKVVPI